MRYAKIVATAVFFFVMTSCGGGGGGGGGDSGGTGVVRPANAAVGGIWTGTISPVNEEADAAFGIIAEDGRAYFLDEWWRMYWGTVTASGTILKGSLTYADAEGYTLWDDSYSAAVSLTGTVASRNTIGGNWSLVSDRNGYKTGILAFDYDQLYEEDSSLQKIAGNYIDALGFDQSVTTISANGEIFAQDPLSSCVINGRVSLINSAYNAYDIRYSLNNCQPNDWFFGASFEGLAFIEPATNLLYIFVHRLDGEYPEPLFAVLELT